MTNQGLSYLLLSLLVITVFSFTGLAFESWLGGSSGGGSGPGSGPIPDDPPTADFTWNPEIPEVGENVDFTDESSEGDAPIVEWNWEFEEHGDSTDQNPSVSFTEADTYLVTLQIEDENGLTDTESKNIQVTEDDSWIPPPPTDPDYPVECHVLVDGELFDSDQDGETGLDDTGCVAPLEEDDIEGSIWENTLSTTMHEEPTGTGSLSRANIYFADSAVIQGNEIDTTVNEDEVNEVGNDIEINTNWIYAEGSEGGDREDWGFGILNDEDQEFISTDAAVDSGDRVVLPPHDLDGGMCGDGFENTDDRTDPEGDDDSSQPTNDDGYTTDCRADWGRRWERYDVSTRGSEQPWEPSSQTGNTQTTDTGLLCRNDDQKDDDSGDSIDFNCEDGQDSECTDGGSSCGNCGSSDETQSATDATCDESTEDHSSDESNEYWIIDGDDLVLESCEVQASNVLYDEADGGSESECSDYSSTIVNGSCVSCDPDGDTTYSPGGGSDIERRGDDRDWEEVDRTDCSRFDTTDGGGEPSQRYQNSEAGSFTSFTAYEDSNWGSDGRVWCGYDHITTVNADGPTGLGNGFVVIEEGEILATENFEREDEVGRHVTVDGSRMAGQSAQDTFLDMIDTDCNGKRTCIKYVNYYTSSSFDISDNPSASELAGEAVEVDASRAYTPDESYSVCKNINRINQDVNGFDLLDCDFMQEDNDGNHVNIAPLPQACGDDEDEHVMLFDGPQVDQSTVRDYPQYYQSCVSWDSSDDEGFFFDEHGETLDQNACTIKNEAVAEGTVANVASNGEIGSTVIDEEFEEGGESPDWQVCLNIDQDNSEKPYNHRYNDDSNTGYGGQWYDLDDSQVNSYLQSNEGSLDLSTDQRVGSPRYIDYYYGENPSPFDSTYNPEGGSSGVSLVADCGPLLDGCGDDSDEVRGDINAEEGTYFGFFEEGTWDDDAHPHGGPENEDYNSPVQPIFSGYMNMIKTFQDVSNSRYDGQLNEDHPDYDLLDPEWYENTQVDTDNSIIYSYTDRTDWVIDSTGAPYPAYSADTSEIDNYGNGNILEEGSESLGIHYNTDFSGNIRDDIDDSDSFKTDRAMGNSMAVIAARTLTDDEGNQIAEEEAFWIDPDDIRYHLDEGNIARFDDDGELETVPEEDWRSLISFEMDLTGPDQGLGWDYDEDQYMDEADYEPDEVELINGDVRTIAASIGWQKDENGDIVDELEPPICGDDQEEYLLEEKGETRNSPQYEGTYACSTTRDRCVYDSELYERGDIVNTNEPGEDEGRLKQDREVCSQAGEIDPNPIWFDQDYAEMRPDENTQELCQANNLFGIEGKRWIDYNYINDNPHAVNRGIDDSWNQRLADANHDYYVSDPEGQNWDDSPLDNNYSPVPTETRFDRVADPSFVGGQQYGFCAGDDSAEYLIHQESQTRLVDSDQEIIGVASNPDTCVLDNSEFENINDDDLDRDYFTADQLQDEKMLYQEGDSVTFDSGDTRRTVACFGGEWWSEWPITFLEDTATVDLGETGFTMFRIINPDDSSKTFDLGINPRGTDPYPEGSGTVADNLDQMVNFESTGTNDMTVTVPGQSSNTYRLEIDANREIDTTGTAQEDIEVFAQSSDGSLDGGDQVDIEVVDPAADGQGQTRSIPGLTIVQLAVIVAISSLLFFRN